MKALLKLENILWLIIGITVLIGVYFYTKGKDIPQENTASNAILTLSEKMERYEKYKEIENPGGFVNTDGAEVKIADYIGNKVILLDVMTYSCINCQRTFPYVVGWYEKYQDDGLIVIGIHTPEFAFEKDIDNVTEAMKDFGIVFPVVLDNEYATWNAYGNRYWPRKYLIDIDGYIVYDHIGEGAYAETENAIRRALNERNNRLGLTVPDMPDGISIVDPIFDVSTPEIYFGSLRNTLLATGQREKEGVQTFPDIEVPIKNLLYLSGTWNIQEEYAQAQKESVVHLKYEAKDVYTVASAQKGGTIEVFLDGQSIGVIEVKDEKLYTLVQGDSTGVHTLELKVSPGVEMFTFTFG